MSGEDWEWAALAAATVVALAGWCVFAIRNVCILIQSHHERLEALDERMRAIEAHVARYVLVDESTGKTEFRYECAKCAKGESDE